MPSLVLSFLAKTQWCHFFLGDVAVGAKPLLGAVWGPIYASGISTVIFQLLKYFSVNEIIAFFFDHKHIYFTLYDKLSGFNIRIICFYYTCYVLSLFFVWYDILFYIKVDCISCFCFTLVIHIHNLYTG